MVQVWGQPWDPFRHFSTHSSHPTSSHALCPCYTVTPLPTCSVPGCLSSFPPLSCPSASPPSRLSPGVHWKLSANQPLHAVPYHFPLVPGPVLALLPVSIHLNYGIFVVPRVLRPRWGWASCRFPPPLDTQPSAEPWHLVGTSVDEGLEGLREVGFPFLTGGSDALRHPVRGHGHGR